MRNLIGPLIHADGSPAANVTLVLAARRVNWSADGLVASSSEHRFDTDDNGDFIIAVAPGDYDVWYLMPNGGKQRLGQIAVEDGSTVELAELIELSRDMSADLSISADWATKSWVTAEITIGAQPYDVAITALNPGAATAGQLLKIVGGTVQGFDLELKDYPVGTGVSFGELYLDGSNKLAAYPIRRLVSANTVAALGEQLLVDMNAAAGDIEITLPAGLSIAQPPLKLIIISDTYVLPHTLTVKRVNAAHTIMGAAADITIDRRRTMELHYAGGNDWRFT